MNYAEEYAFWYLRLNGFFPITNFVIHKSTNIKYTSDCDVLAVRPPFVYEEIGGQSEDWDRLIHDFSNSDITVGIICEVKSGSYNPSEIFRSYNVEYSVGRLGFTEDVKNVANQLEESAVVDIGTQYRIVKLLIANEVSQEGNFISTDLNHIREFIRERIEKYPKEKYRDRMFFDSIALQIAIDTTVLGK